jgi:hypothetical protein
MKIEREGLSTVVPVGRVKEPEPGRREQSLLIRYLTETFARR